MIFFRTLKAFLSDKEYRDLLLTGITILIMGTLVYHELEGWTYLDAFYFSFITLTTIGFGDFAPQTDAGKIFTIIYITIGVGIILAFINTLYHHYSTLVKRKVKKNSRGKKED
ncbi:Ion channel [Ekhidna lutea]|uniref:Ion channel n=1 Tax=Ekhidna lutea TaxID=447679 RepID=A0A239L931_EKHLU|nr:potassium channel family protein [Ekhidna lutea]SNT27137.1 Ion channel [Ekhidna lutea]